MGQCGNDAAFSYPRPALDDGKRTRRLPAKSQSTLDLLQCPSPANDQWWKRWKHTRGDGGDRRLETRRRVMLDGLVETSGLFVRWGRKLGVEYLHAARILAERLGSLAVGRVELHKVTMRRLMER